MLFISLSKKQDSKIAEKENLRKKKKVTELNDGDV